MEWNTNVQKSYKVSLSREINDESLFLILCFIWKYARLNHTEPFKSWAALRIYEKTFTFLILSQHVADMDVCNPSSSIIKNINSVNIMDCDD